VAALSSLTAELRNLGSRFASSQSTNSTDVASAPYVADDNATFNIQDRPESARKRRRPDPQHVDLSEDGDSCVKGAFDILKDEEFLTKLVNVYFTHVQPWIPVLHEPTFRRRLRQPDERRKVDIILHGILVAAARYMTHQGQPWPVEYMERTSERSRDHALLSGMSGLSVENLQALIIIAFTDVCVSHQIRT
jgi:hypothetical protein